MSLTEDEKLKGYMEWVRLQPPVVESVQSLYRMKSARRLLSPYQIRKMEMACVDDEKRMRKLFGWILKEIYGYENPCFHFYSGRRGITCEWKDHGHKKCDRVQGAVRTKKRKWTKLKRL